MVKGFVPLKGGELAPYRMNLKNLYNFCRHPTNRSVWWISLPMGIAVRGPGTSR
jgi:hypothetical protein